MPLAERYIISQAHSCAMESAKSLEAYAVGDAGKRASDFFYNDFADWYIEISKTRTDETFSDTTQISPECIRVLTYCFELSLKLIHPFMPHVTEFLWQNLFGSSSNADALIVASYPAMEDDELAVDISAIRQFELWK